MDQEIITRQFRENDIPSWDCPICGRGSLTLVEGTFTKNFSMDIDTSHRAFDPVTWIEYIFTMMLRCSNTSCKVHVSCTGIGHVEQEYTEGGSGKWDWVDYFKPKFFEPALKLFFIPPDTPDDVTDELSQSFSLFFKYPSMSLVSLRKALEILISDLGISSERANGGFLSLNEKIKLLPDKHKQIIDPVTAIKWLGNDGAHGDQVSTDDVLDGYKIFEHVLDELYPVEKVSVKKIVDRINSVKGIGK